MRQVKQLLHFRWQGSLPILWLKNVELASAQHDLLSLPLKCQGLRKQLTEEPEPSGFCSSPVARGGCFESLWGVLWEKWGLLAFHNCVGLSGNTKGYIYVNRSICLPGTLYSPFPAVFVLNVLLFQRREKRGICYPCGSMWGCHTDTDLWPKVLMLFFFFFF